MPLHPPHALSEEDLSRLRRLGWIGTIEYHTTLTSTNDRARELAEDHLAILPALIVADEQSAGRGRGTNRWWTGRGSLAFSLLIDPAQQGIARKHCPQLSLVAALAIIDTITEMLPMATVGLHWPNDVFVNRRKVAGILAEALADGRHILGIGLNTNNSVADAPLELRQVATTLRDLAGDFVDQGQVLARLTEHLHQRCQQLAERPDSLGPAYNERCLQRGIVLTLQHGTQRITGCCAGIAADGALRLETQHGAETFYAGFLIKD